MRNRSTRAIVGLLIVTGLATSQLKQAGLIVTGSVMPTLNCSAPSTMLTFDEGDFAVVQPTNIPRYTVSPPTTAPVGGTIVTNQFRSAGVTFESVSTLDTWVYIAERPDPSSTTPLSPSPGRVLSTLILHGDTSLPTNTLVIRFVNPADGTASTALGSSISFWAYGRGDGPLTFRSYDANGALLETKTVTAGSTTQTYGTVQFTTGNVARIEGVNTGLPRQGLAIDNLAYRINAADCPPFYATTSDGKISDANGVLQVPSGSNVQLTWNLPVASSPGSPAQCLPYSLLGSANWGANQTLHTLLYNDSPTRLSCSGTASIPNVTTSQTYYITGDAGGTVRAVSIVVQPAAGPVSGIGGAAANTIRAFGPSGQVSDTNGVIQVPSGSNVHIEWNLPVVSSPGLPAWCYSYSLLGSSNWGANLTLHTWLYNDSANRSPCSGTVSIPNVTTSQTYYITGDAGGTVRAVSIVVQPASGPVSGIGGAASDTIRAFGPSGETTNAGTLTAPSGSTVHIEWNLPVASSPGLPGWCYAYADATVSGWGQGSTTNGQHRVPCKGILSVANLTAARTFTMNNGGVRQVRFTPGGTAVSQCIQSNTAYCGPKGCPGGNITYGSKTYLRYDTAAGSWANARTHCQSLGGDLVSINDAGEQNAVYGGLVGTAHHDIWIGLSDTAAEGTFKWVDGTTPTYTNWQPGNPDDGYFNEDCVELNYKDHAQTGKWNDFRCSDGYGDNTGFICEIPTNCAAPLIGRWNFDTATASAAPDSSGRGNDGIVIGATPVNGCMQFDGTNDYINIGPVGQQLTQGGFSFAAWAKKEDGGGGIDPSGNQNNTPVLIHSGSGGVGYFSRTGPTTVWGIGGDGAVSTSSLNPGTFYHIAVTTDGQTAKVYVNGVLEGTKALNRSFARLPDDFTLGTNTNAASNFWGWFKGTMDDVRVYNGVLSASEIAALAAVQPSCATAVQCVDGGYEYQLTMTSAGYGQSGPPPAGTGWVMNDSTCLVSNASAQCVTNAVLWRKPSAQPKQAILTSGCSNPGVGYSLKVQIPASSPLQTICLWERNVSAPVDLLLGHAGTGLAVNMNCNTSVDGQNGSVDKPPADYAFQSRICVVQSANGICTSDLCLFEKTLNACASSSSSASEFSCKALDFDASNGHFVSQGWISAAEPAGSVTAVTEDGVEALRMIDNSSTTGVAMRMPIPASVVEDKDWALEMRAKIRESIYHTPIGINMLLLVANNRHIGLYIDKDKFGPIRNNVTYIQTANKNTTDAFHTYVIRHKKNGAGKADDAIDVYFDGAKVISNVAVSEIFNQASESNGYLTVGQISSEGQGSMDLQYIRFSNNESPCVTYGTICGVSEFYAEDGSFESQGWSTVNDSSPDTNLTGPTTANGVTYVRLSDQSATNGMRTSDLDITNAMLADRDWSLEMKARAVDSDPNGYVLGMNMLLVTPNEVSTSLFIDENKFGLQAATPNAYTWGPSVSRTTTDTFHTYVIKNKKNGAGAADDTIDVYFDGSKVISNIARSQLYVYDAGTGIQGISFGIGSSPGKGIMDVSYVKFKNDEASCPANPFKATKPQCSDGIDNDGDGKTDYWVQTAAVQTFGPVLLPDVYLPAPPDTPKQLRPYTLVTGLTAGQKIATGPVGGTFDNSGSPGACAGIVGPGRVYIPVDYVNDSGTVIKSEVAWDGANLTVPAGATQLRGYAPIVGSSCTLSGSVYDAPPAFDPDCSSASDDSESSGTCTDSDGGNTPLSKGFVNASEGTLKTASDSCDATGKLTEYFCDTDKTIKSAIAVCEPGFTCTDGACKASAASSVAANPARVGFGGVAFDGNDIIFMPLQNGDLTYHGNVLSFGPVCKPGECGDGVLTSDEQCDDGNTTNGDGCNAKCIWEPYGSAASSSSSNSSSSSSSSSSFAVRCGDGIISPPEKCDDGNALGGDGCSAFCQIETGWQCTPRLP